MNGWIVHYHCMNTWCGSYWPWIWCHCYIFQDTWSWNEMFGNNHRDETAADVQSHKAQRNSNPADPVPAVLATDTKFIISDLTQLTSSQNVGISANAQPQHERCSAAHYFPLLSESPGIKKVKMKGSWVSLPRSAEQLANVLLSGEAGTSKRALQEVAGQVK